MWMRIATIGFLVVSSAIASSVVCAETTAEQIDKPVPSNEAVSNSESRLQGIWFYRSKADQPAYLRSSLVLVVQSDRLVVIRSSGAAESVFRTDENKINVDRYDGSKQCGLFQVSEDVLRLTLGDPGKPRPAHQGVWKGKKKSKGERHAYYEFHRKPTTKGMEMLSRYLSGDLRVAKPEKRVVKLEESLD